MNKDQRDEFITLRLTRHERQLLERAAGRDDRTLSEYVRTYALRAAHDVLARREQVARLGEDNNDGHSR